MPPTGGGRRGGPPRRVVAAGAGEGAATRRGAATGEAILVPVLNEAGAIGPFLGELAPQARGRRVYLLDSGSQDGTAAEALAAARSHAIDLTVLDCPPGLAESIRFGVERSREARIAVIDGDGQHAPSAVDALFAALADGCDAAVASRRAVGATIAADWPRHRRLASGAFVWVARQVLRRHGVRDPSIGCFALRRRAWERTRRFETGGYKFLFDFLASAPRLRLAEVPLTFRPRGAGRSKVALPVLWELFVSITRAALQCRVPRRWISLGGVGSLGAVVDVSLMWLLHGALGIAFAWARPAPILWCITQNYLLNNALTFAATRRRGAVPLLRGWALHLPRQLGGAALNWGVSVGLFGIGAPWLAAVLAGALAGAAVNCVTAWGWRLGRAEGGVG